MFLKQYKFLLLFSFLYLISVYFKMATANTIFRFGFNFDLNGNETFLKTSFQLENTDKTTTMSPILTDIWSRQAQLNSTANTKIQATRIAVMHLHNEISSLTDSSSFIATKVKLMSRYLHNLNAPIINNTTLDNDASLSSGDGNHAAAENFLILQDYVQLVDDLRAPPTNLDEGEHSLDYMVMKLGLEKHKLIQLQTEILKDVFEAMEAWQTYTKKQIIDMSAV